MGTLGVPSHHYWCGAARCKLTNNLRPEYADPKAGEAATRETGDGTRGCATSSSWQWAAGPEGIHSLVIYGLGSLVSSSVSCSQVSTHNTDKVEVLTQNTVWTLTLYPLHGVPGNQVLGLILEGYGVLIRFRSARQSSIHVTVSEFQARSIGLGVEGCSQSQPCTVGVFLRYDGTRVTRVDS